MSYDVVQRLRSEDQGGLAIFLISVAACIGTVFLGSGLLHFQTPDQIVGSGMVLAGCVAVGAFFGVIASTFNDHVLAKRRYQRNVRALLAGNTWPQVLRTLAPNLRLWGGHWRNQVQLPEPPADVADIILRASKMNTTMYVAAEANAIGFVGGMEKLFGAGYEQLLEQEAEARRDPIIYVQSGGNIFEGESNAAVAIIAQFGDFPVEREVVDRLVAGGRLF